MYYLYLLGLFLGINTHDTQVAFYKIYEESDALHIEFTFEKKDILYEFKEKSFDLSDQSLQDYLNENYSIVVNDVSQNLHYGQIVHKQGHIYVYAELLCKVDKVNSLEVINTCLLSIPEHANIIQIQLKDQQRDFLMNAKRTRIQVNY